MGYYTTNGGLVGSNAYWNLQGVYDLTQARLGARGSVVYSSRSSNVTEGTVSNYATAAAVASSWNYTGNNTDAIVITTTGATAKLQGWTISNYVSGTNALSGTMYVVQGSSTGGTILKQQAFTSVPLSTGVGQTMFTFSDGGIELAPGTYTIAFGWGASQTINTYQQNTGVKTTSSVVGSSGTLGITYSNATFGGVSPLNTTNGTSATGSGQLTTLQWYF